MSPKNLLTVAWGSSLIAAGLAFIAWGQGIEWELDSLNTYKLFPLFGLLAFSIMWSQHIASAVKRSFNIDGSVLKTYFVATSWVVLAAILLHPGLLAWQLWLDGAGLPPGSELDYVGKSLRFAVILGMTAWLMFLSYELHRWFSKKSWWKFIQYLSEVAMLMILFHGLKLGGELGQGWFRGVWFFYGVSLIVSMFVIYSPKSLDQKP